MSRQGRHPIALSALLALALLAGCRRGGPAAASADHTVASAATTTTAAPAPTHVDSIFPPEEALRRFRATVADTPAVLTGGERSRDALAEAFVRAVEQQDTAAIRRLVLSRGEFAYLYYPESPFARRPLYQPPELLWMQLRMASEKGIVRTIRRLGGDSLHYVGLRCAAEPKVQGKNRLWEGCVVRRRSGAGIEEQRLFGTILERGGHYKFVGYANQF